jgi:threonyl-tRNA synthetase
MLIVGEKEEAEGTLSVRKHGGEDLGSMKTEEFVAILQNEINNALNIN